MAEWTRVISLMEENYCCVKSGFELAEIIRNEFKGEEIRIPSKLPVAYIVPIVKKELKSGSNYERIAATYGLSVKTVRRYETWNIQGGKLVSPDGHEYLLGEDPI